MRIEIALARDNSIGGRIEELIRTASTSIDAALYRFSNSRLATELAAAARRGVRIRLVQDRNKYRETRQVLSLLAGSGVSLRVLGGREGFETKMHHKFALFDKETAITGSYNWTLESETQNYENLLILREQKPAIEILQKEFEALWAESSRIPD